MDDETHREADASRRLRLMAASLVGLLALVGGINYAVNPYGAWRISLIERKHRLDALPIYTDASTEAAQRMAMAYRLRIDEPTTVLAGSSRVRAGMRMRQGYADGVFNAAVSGAALGEIDAILGAALRGPQVRRVIWGLDFFAFDESYPLIRFPETLPRLGRHEAWPLQRAFLKVTDTLLSLQALEDSRKVLVRALGDESAEASPVPWPEPYLKQRLARLLPDLEPTWPVRFHDEHADIRKQMAYWIGRYPSYHLSAAALGSLRQTIAEIAAAEVEGIVFVPPTHECELATIDLSGQWPAFQDWKRQILTVAGPYWDFSGYNRMNRNEHLFSDFLHFDPAVGHTILRFLLGYDCAECGDVAKMILDSAVWVDATTIDAHLEKQAADRARRAREPSRCRELAKEIERESLSARSATEGPLPPGEVR